MTATHRPWSGLDPDIARLLRPAVRTVSDVAVLEIPEQIPSLGGDLAGDYGQALRRGIDLALGRLLDLFGTDEAALDPALTAVYESFGERESRHGRPLDALLAAYRIGARTAWAHLSAAAVDGGVEVRQLVMLAEAIFVYIDELSGASASGHARDHAARAGHRDLLRSRLALALVEGQAATSPARVHELADDVGWAFPARMAVAVLPVPSVAGPSGAGPSGAGPSGAGRSPSLPIPPPDVLTVTQDGEVLAVLPDPSGPGRRARLSSLVNANGEVYVGTVRPPEEAQVSLAHARAVHRLVLDGVLPPAPVVAAADHLPELVLHADPRLLAELTARALAPLAGLTPPRQAVLRDTLRAWLAHHGNRSGVAEELGVHPQTVSYRLTQLSELLGPALEEPRGRLTLVLALGATPPPAQPPP